MAPSITSFLEVLYSTMRPPLQVDVGVEGVPALRQVASVFDECLSAGVGGFSLPSLTIRYLVPVRLMLNLLMPREVRPSVSSQVPGEDYLLTDFLSRGKKFSSLGMDFGNTQMFLSESFSEETSRGDGCFSSSFIR